MSTWNLSPRVIIWVPSGSVLGHPYNYTRRQIPSTDVTMLQLLHVHQRLILREASHNTKMHTHGQSRPQALCSVIMGKAMNLQKCEANKLSAQKLTTF